MEQLNLSLLQSVQNGFGKQAFVPMPGGSGEPVAGASQATAAMAQPVGAQGGQPPAQAGGMPQPGGAPQGQPQQGAGGEMPPELAEALQDPQIQQMLAQAGFNVDPASGQVIDPATGQPMPPEQVMQVIQQLMQAQQAGDPTAQPQPQSPGGQDPNAAQQQSQQDPVAQIVQLLKDISVKLDKLTAGGGKEGAGGEKEKKLSTDEKMDQMMQGMQRVTEMLGAATGQQ